MDHCHTRSFKRKLEQDLAEDQGNRKVLRLNHLQDLPSLIIQQLALLNSAFSPSDSDRASARSALHVLSQLATDEEIVDTLVNCGVVPALVKLLERPGTVTDEADGVTDPYKYEVEKGCALVLGLIAIEVIKFYSLIFSIIS